MVRPIRNYLFKIFRCPRATLQNWWTLSVGFGHFKSALLWKSIDGNSDPIPWFTYPAVDYLKQFDLSDRTVFEYGSGNSTHFWAARCREVISIEHSKEWYQRVQTDLPNNVTYLLREQKERYVEEIDQHENLHDIVVVDGMWRHDCAVAARKKLKEGGVLILDNSDWAERTAAYLRSTDLIEVDFSGFTPMNNYTSVTTFFLTRGFDFAPEGERQPKPSVGAMPHRNRW